MIMAKPAHTIPRTRAEKLRGTPLANMASVNNRVLPHIFSEIINVLMKYICYFSNTDKHCLIDVKLVFQCYYYYETMSCNSVTL